MPIVESYSESFDTAHDLTNEHIAVLEWLLYVGYERLNFPEHSAESKTAIWSNVEVANPDVNSPLAGPIDGRHEVGFTAGIAAVEVVTDCFLTANRNRSDTSERGMWRGR
jgi:hypothetical protein